MIYTLFFLTVFFLAFVLCYYFAFERKNSFLRQNFLFVISGIFSFAFFLELFYLIQIDGVIGRFDLAVNSFIFGILSDRVTSLMMLITKLGDNTFLFFLFIILFISLVYMETAKGSKKKPYWEFFIILLIGIILNFFIKNFVVRDRPFGGLIEATGFSFPSGHTTMATIFFLMLIYFFAGEIKNKIAKSLFIFLCSFLILAVGMSRIYLGVHWFSDFLGGIALGTFSVSLGIILANLIKLR